jgi:hypothetical protein
LLKFPEREKYGHVNMNKNPVELKDFSAHPPYILYNNIPDNGYGRFDYRYVFRILIPKEFTEETGD